MRLSIAKRVSVVEGKKEIFAKAGAERNTIAIAIAKRVFVVESKKEIFANAGAERNATAIANTDPFSFVNRDGNS
jgi:hypothetical protein